uniref:MAP3K7 C-terminal-like protein n=1 Tax=Castor canadensis TaxID=51338 RepID=A0A8B7UTE7_CASCN|nr:MAP3K7 C-terminal-like protein [Castor canadensis]
MTSSQLSESAPDWCLHPEIATLWTGGALSQRMPKKDTAWETAQAHQDLPSLPRKELIAKLDQAEKEKVDAAQLVREFEALTEENRTLKLAQSQCVEQLEKLRIQYQKRQGSS